MRKLASIQKVIDIQPIEGADKIERLTVLGWHLVAKKGEFKVGDLCVYVEVDSVLPKTPEFAFMEKYKYRVKTVKLRGQISQGLAIPIPVFLDNPLLAPIGYCKEGADVTEQLGVRKYDPEYEDENRELKLSLEKGKEWWSKYMRFRLFRLLVYPFVKQEKSRFPTEIVSETDETRIQNCPDVISRFARIPFVETEKIEGCLHGDTLIETEKGQKTIKEICENHLKLAVYSFNEMTERKEKDKINGFSVQENNGDWYELETETGEKVKLTGNHPVYVPVLRCYRKVEDLSGNESVLLEKIEMKTVRLKSVKKIESDSKRYDISVRKNHNFFANEILVHNCSGTFVLKKSMLRKDFIVCSRKFAIRKNSISSYWKVAEKFKIGEALSSLSDRFGGTWALQGEITGPSIQKNVYGIKELDFHAFNLKHIGSGGKIEFYDPYEGKNLLEPFGIKWVPILGETILDGQTVDSIVASADGESVLADTLREGKVYRSKAGYPRCSFKAVSNKYLIAHGK